MAKIIGIDLGTTNSVVAVMEGGEPKVIPNEEGGRTTPSVVGFTKRASVWSARWPRTRRSPTRRTPSSPSSASWAGAYDEVSEEMKMVPYKVVQSGRPRGDRRAGQGVHPAEISAMILQKLKKAAEDYLGETVTEAVITVPAYFNDAQRQATKDAGKIAGLDVKRIINEPTAAALAYGLDKKKDEKIAVFDFGGGTFDISILEVGEGVFEVKSTNGDTHLGGDNFDQRVVDWLADEFKQGYGLDLRSKGNEMALQRLKEAAEQAKIELSTTHADRDQSAVHHGRCLRSQAPGEDPDPRQARGDGARPDRQRSIEPCKQALKDAGIDAEQDRRSRAGRRPDAHADDPADGEGPLRQGAASRASTRTKSWPSARPFRAACCSGEVKDLLLLDVTPLSLSIETLGGVATTMIPRNTTIPTRKSETSRPRPTTRPRWRSTCCRASVRWRRRTARWASSIWPAFRRRRAACRRSK